MHFVRISLMQDLLFWSIFSCLTSKNLSFMQNRPAQETNLPACQTDWEQIFLFCKMTFYTYKSVDLTTKCDDPNRSLRVGNISHSRVPLPAFIHMHTCTYFWLTVKIRCIYSDNTHLICVIRRWQCFVFFLWNGLLVKKNKITKLLLVYVFWQCC